MANINDLRSELLDFNAHPIVCEIREKYHTPSFFEMVDKTRSETAHSSFLSWLFKGQGISENTADTPLYLLLSILAKRSIQQETTGTNLMDSDVRDAILSRKIKISSIQTETEKNVSELAELAYDSFDPNADANHRQYLSEIMVSVADRVDIVVNCDVENCGNIKHLIVVIENKVNSNEGQQKNAPTVKRGQKMPSQYASLTQTERYFVASNHKSGSDTAVICVFLTPKLTKNDLAELTHNRTSLKSAWKIAQSDNYININYQDILNGIINKVLILQDGSVTNRTRSFIAEYKNEITYPKIEDPKSHQNIAYPEIKGIEDLWDQYRFLLHSIAYSTVSNKGCIWFELNSDEYYVATYKDRVTSIPVAVQSFFCRGGISQQTTTISNFCSVLSNNGIPCQRIDSNTLTSAMVYGLLSDFADENLEILSTIIGVVKHSSTKYLKEAEELFSVLMSAARDNTKYYVSYKGKLLTPKPVMKSEVAFIIFREWANANNATIADMRRNFPVSINSYYASKKYFNHLFYIHTVGGYYYDGDDPKYGPNVPYIGNWDFYHDSLHQYCGITNLKMWRKDAFESLLSHIKDNHKSFSIDLSITDNFGNSIF